MSYQLVVKPTASREIERLPRSLQRRIVDAMVRVQKEPRGEGSVKLSGTKATYRIRVGDWRVVYEVLDDAQMVFVTIVAHRREVYR